MTDSSDNLKHNILPVIAISFGIILPLCQAGCCGKSMTLSFDSFLSLFQVTQCTETMYRKSWDVQDIIDQSARVRLIDYSSDKWCHINFDDLMGDIICEKNE